MFVVASRKSAENLKHTATAHAAWRDYLVWSWSFVLTTGNGVMVSLLVDEVYFDGTGRMESVESYDWIQTLLT